MSKGLGGWQRLGIVLAIAWTLGVVGVVWNEWPDVHQMQAAHQRLNSRSILRGLPATEDWVTLGNGAWVDGAWVDDAVWQQFQSRQSEMIRVGLMLWLVPLFAVATVAYVSQWVYRGFRPQRVSPAEVESPVEVVSQEEQRDHQSRPDYAGLGGVGEPILLARATRACLIVGRISGFLIGRSSCWRRPGLQRATRKRSRCNRWRHR
jgi:hypothetical protein